MNKSLDTSNKPLVSLCMIVKNERENLPRCLASVKPYVEEMIVVDTGSEDGTPEIASNYGAKVRYFEWCDDFAAARNYSIAQASGEWILVLDADEELVVSSEDIFLKELVSQSEVILYSLSLTEANNKGGFTPAWLPRLFRNISGIKYEGCYHEQLLYKEKGISNKQSGYLNKVKNFTLRLFPGKFISKKSNS